MRTRNLKPKFFKNEYLGSLSIYARYLFAGLWCLADREGRLEDRPKQIEAEIFPYDDIDIEKLLGELTKNNGDHPFILRYQINGKRYIQILNFKKHQSVHPKECPSIIPPPPEPYSETPEITRQTPEITRLNHSFPSFPSFPSSPSSIPYGNELALANNNQLETNKYEKKQTKLSSNCNDFAVKQAISDKTSLNSKKQTKVAPSSSPHIAAPPSPSPKSVSKTHFLLNEYRRLYEAKYGIEPVQNFGKDGAIAKRIMKQPAVNEENIIPLLEKFFQENDDFIQKTGHTLGVFEKKLPGYLENRKRIKISETKFDEPVSIGEATEKCLTILP